MMRNLEKCRKKVMGRRRSRKAARRGLAVALLLLCPNPRTLPSPPTTELSDSVPSRLPATPHRYNIYIASIFIIRRRIFVVKR